MGAPDQIPRDLVILRVSVEKKLGISLARLTQSEPFRMNQFGKHYRHGRDLRFTAAIAKTRKPGQTLFTAAIAAPVWFECYESPPSPDDRTAGNAAVARWRGRVSGLD
jgi:hypothetical protein